MKLLILKIVACVCMGIACLTTKLLYKHKKIGKSDNQIEEVAEYLIEKVSDIKVDLSPDSGDKEPDIKDIVDELQDLFEEDIEELPS